MATTTKKDETQMGSEVSRSYGSWIHIHANGDEVTLRIILEDMLRCLPESMLDADVLKRVPSIKLAIKEPHPTYEDPLGQRGFAAWKVTQNKGD